MRTEDDLRNALERIATKAPDFTPIFDDEPAVRPVRRRRTPLVLATVMATAAAIGGPILVDHQRETSTQPAGEQAASSWRNWITLTAPPGMTINSRLYEANRQIYELAGVGKPWSGWCLLTLHRNGDFDPGKIPADSPRIDINGLAGRLINLPVGYTMASGRQVRPAATVAWQPTKGIWALASCERQQESGTRMVPAIVAPTDSDNATGVVVAKTIKATPQRLAAPFQVGHLPAGLRTERVLSKTANTGAGQVFSVAFTDGNAATGTKPRPGTSGNPDNSQAMKMLANAWEPPSMPGDDLNITYNTGLLWNSRTRAEIFDPADLKIRDWKAW